MATLNRNTHADTLSAYLKCLSELRTGNLEFTVTARKLESQLNASSLPEVAYFMQTFVPDFAMPFDGVLEGRQAQALVV